MIPTKPIIPRNDTHTAVMSDASSRDTHRSSATFTPMLPAASPPLSSALYRQASAAKTVMPAAVTASMIQSARYVARPRSPKLQITAAESPTSVA